jgi:hypothetical protein
MNMDDFFSSESNFFIVLVNLTILFQLVAVIPYLSM